MKTRVIVVSKVKRTACGFSSYRVKSLRIRPVLNSSQAKENVQALE
jgi:hypothetical protein